MSLATRAFTSGAATVGAASGQIVGVNQSRRELTIVNDHATQIVYLALNVTDGVTAPTAALNSGIRLNAAGGSWTTNVYKGVVSAIATGAGTGITIAEI